jgi:hypothetical protein
MTGTSVEQARDHADLALIVYLEDLLRDRRVLLVGETSPRVERRLSDAARTLDVVSRERRARRRGLPLRAWPTPAEKGTWDAIVIPDLAAAGLGDAARFDEMAALLPDGVFVAAIEAQGAELGYEAFLALFGARFEGARWLAQAPMHGFALAELGASTPDVSYDASSVELAPARFVGVAAPRSAGLDAYAVIATPRVTEPSEHPSADAQKHEREAEATRTRLEHAEKRLEQAQREIARSAQKLDEARHERARIEETLRARDIEQQAASAHESDAVRAARDECDAIERRLRVAAHEVTALRGENERRGVLVRDLVEELRRTGQAPTAGVASLDVPSRAEVQAELSRAHEALSTAQRRTVEAEARRAELSFRVDELTADLASVGQAHEKHIADLVREHAAAQGAARGMTSRVAELAELRLVAESRLALVEDDLRQAREKARGFERRLAESQEQLELARIPRPKSEGDPAKEGQLFGALMRARETLAEREVERAELLSEIARLRAALEVATHERAATSVEAARRASALEAEASLRAGQLEHRNTELANMREERDSLVTRVVALESVPPPPPMRDEERERALEAELDALRGECTGLRLRAVDADAAAEAARAVVRGIEARAETAEASARGGARRAAEIASRLASRDALVSRLQSDLTQAGERHGALERAAQAMERRLSNATESIGALEAVSSVRSDEERRERDSLVLDLNAERAKAARLDTERASAIETLRDVREGLGRIAGSLGDLPRAPIPTAPEGLIREEMTRLVRDVEDRDLMLRSLTAQLEERDDRIRALERMSKGDAPNADVQRLLETEERIARLSAELTQERKARERVESTSALVSREAELRRLEQLLGDRDAQLMLLEGRVEGASRDEESMRRAFAQARERLEAILAHIAEERHGDAVEHATELLSSLRKY